MARRYKDWLQAYIDFTRDSESPLGFHFWTGVWTIAAALQRRVWIDMRKFQWTPNFYIILVGPPGIAAKSTSARGGQALLSHVDGITIGSQSMTWQKLTEDLGKAILHIDYLGENNETLTTAQSALSLNVSELGTFLKPEDPTFTDVLISLWDGQLEEWTHGTKTTGSTSIRNPWLNIIGCTTPSWLKNNFPEHMVGGGLTSRIVFVYGDKKRHLVPYPDEVRPMAEYKQLEEGLIHDLKQMAELKGPYMLDPLARHWGHQWYEQHWSQRSAEMAGIRYEGYIARKQTHMHKLAMILAAAKRNERIILREDLIGADKLLKVVEPDMRKVFESVGVVDESKRVIEIKSLLAAHGEMTATELWALCQTTMDLKSWEAALKAALQAGDIVKGTKNGQNSVKLAKRAT